MECDWNRCHHFEYWILKLSGKEAQQILDLPNTGGKVGVLEIKVVRHDYIGFTNWHGKSRDQKKPCEMRVGNTYFKKFRAKIKSAMASAIKNDNRSGGAAMHFESEDGYAEFLNELTINVHLKHNEKVRVVDKESA